MAGGRGSVSRAAFAGGVAVARRRELGHTDDARTGLWGLAKLIPQRPRDGIWPVPPDRGCARTWGTRESCWTPARRPPTRPGWTNWRPSWRMRSAAATRAALRRRPRSGPFGGRAGAGGRAGRPRPPRRLARRARQAQRDPGDPRRIGQPRLRQPRPGSAPGGHHPHRPVLLLYTQPPRPDHLGTVTRRVV